MSLLHFAEVFLLVLSAVVLGLGIRSRQSPSRFLALGAFLALGFVAIYFSKIFTLPTLRYPQDANLRGTYLLILIIHATLIPLAIGTCVIGLILARLKRRIRFDSWIRVAAVLWIIGATSGVICAVLLYTACGTGQC